MTSLSITLTPGARIDTFVYPHGLPILSMYTDGINVSISNGTRDSATPEELEVAKALATAAVAYATELEKCVKPADAGDLDPLANDSGGGR